MSKQEFVVNITETTVKSVTVSAENKNSAIELVQQMVVNDDNFMQNESDNYLDFDCSIKKNPINDILFSQNVQEIVIRELFADSNWTVTDEDLVLIKKYYKGGVKLKNLISDCFRLDSKTQRLIVEGWIIFDGDAYFFNEDDAVAYLNNLGFKGDNMQQIYAGSDGKYLDSDETYWTEWV